MFENFMSNEINVIVDISASMSSDIINNISNLIDCDNCNKINIILVDTVVRLVEVISDLSELPSLINKVRLGVGGTDLQPGIKYILDNNLEQNKTYIVSDFYIEPLDYSGLSDYKEINV